jgi:hypothetical protein
VPQKAFVEERCRSYLLGFSTQKEHVPDFETFSGQTENFRAQKAHMHRFYAFWEIDTCWDFVNLDYLGF